MKKRQLIPIVVLLIFSIGVSVCMASAEAPLGHSISPRQFKQLLEEHRSGSNIVLLDIRTLSEYRVGHIEGALLLDYYAGDFVDRLKALDRDKTYLVYCRSGNRSAKTLAMFEKLGFHSAYHLGSGINGWKRENYPLVR